MKQDEKPWNSRAASCQTKSYFSTRISPQDLEAQETLGPPLGDLLRRNRWMDGRTDGRTDGWMDGRTDDGWMDGPTMDRRTDGRTDGWMDGWTFFS